MAADDGRVSDVRASARRGLTDAQADAAGELLARLVAAAVRRSGAPRVAPVVEAAAA